MQRNNNLSQFLENEVYPSLYRRLKEAFPEFGWKQKGHFWVATIESITRNLPGSPRPDRVVAYQNTPFGFVIQGAEMITWIEYLTGCKSQRGKVFIDTVKNLADLASVPFPELLPNPKGRSQELLETVAHLTHLDLLGERGEKGRAYLTASRGFKEDQLGNLEIGYFPSVLELYRKLKLSGFRKEEIDAPAILNDSRWEGRIIGPWRNRLGQIINFWSRDISGEIDQAEKYLMLKGGKKNTPFQIHAVRGNHLILVEGILDAIVLKSHGISQAVAIGGSSLKCEQVDDLLQHPPETLTLNLDYDGPNGPGHQGTVHAVDKLSTAPFPVFVIPPEAMAFRDDPNKKVDPDLFVRQFGKEGYERLLQNKFHLFRYKAKTLMQKYGADGEMTDTQLVKLMREAHAYTAYVLKNPERQTDLYLFFWQELIEYLGISWSEWELYFRCQPMPQAAVTLNQAS